MLWRDDEAAPRLSAAVARPARTFGFHLVPTGWRPVRDHRATPLALATFAARVRGQTVHALAGIARPERFFDTVRDCGIVVDRRHALPDHVVADASLLPPPPAIILMTAKDAVKFARFADERCWCLEVRAHLDPALLVWLEETLLGPSPD
jgi:tetraacyldisaccharide 4'-kinase